MCCLLYDDQSAHTNVIRAFLLETLDVKFSGVVGQLYSNHVVSAVERDDITAEKTSFRANEQWRIQAESFLYIFTQKVAKS